MLAFGQDRTIADTREDVPTEFQRQFVRQDTDHSHVITLTRVVFFVLIRVGQERRARCKDDLTELSDDLEGRHID